MDPFLGWVISREVLALVAELDEFKGRWSATPAFAPDALRSLRRVATIESVGSSTRIEGVKLTDAEIDALLSGAEPRSFRSRDEQEVAGYADAMALVFESWEELPPTENHLRQLHGVLLRHSDKDERHRGHYKTLANHVEAFDAQGKSLGVVFQTTSPFETPRKMAELVRWLGAELEGCENHPLLVIAAFLVRLLAIHPFQDGNGRLARVATTLLLLRAGYGWVPYSSLERVIEDNKDGYYLALRRAQGTLDRGEGQLSEWVVFFLRCLVQQKKVFERKLVREQQMAQVPELDRLLLELAREHGRLTVAMAVAALGKNRNTVKLHLSQLVEQGRLRLNGRGRGAWYQAS